MKQLKLTPWFHHAIKPVRVGVYEVAFHLKRQETFPCYAFWNGQRWGYLDTTKKGAKEYPNFASAEQKKYWRGILK